jgi:HK97 family phage major capsid protein
MTSGDNTLGGYLIPDAMANAVYALRSRYGVARQECQVIEMDGAVLDIPRLDTEVSASFVGEHSTINASDPGIGSIRIEPKKVAAMSVFSNEVADDALVGIVEMLTSSIAFSFAKLEDQCLFLGDGTSTYGGINGLANALQAGSRITATNQTSYSALTLASFEKVMADTKRFGGALKWYMSRVAWASGPLRLMNAVGGTSATELSQGVTQRFMGYEVVIVEDMHASTGASTGSIAAFFGDLRQGVMFGSRKTITAKVDESRYLESDATALRVVERFDIVVADRGTAAIAGGITALIFG